MKKFLRRFAVLLAVFILGTAGTAFLLNSESTDDRSDMNNPTLPEVIVDFGGTPSNLMHGYTQPMQADFVRECITPLDTSKTLTLVIDPHEAEVESLAWEIRSSDGTKVMENRKIRNLEEGEDYLRASVEISSGLLMNQEYSMQLTLETDGGDAYYYTRVVSRSSTNTEEYVKFASDFAQKCMNKTSADSLATYLEPQASGARNFADISITSPLSDISWGNLSPQMSRAGVPVIKEINETTASVSLEYEISAVNENGGVEFYNVTDLYRMRYTESRIMLLDFERTTEQIFNPNLPVIGDTGLLLGVRDRNVAWMTDEEGGVVAFVQAGELWTYAPETGKFVKVFSFRRDDSRDSRDSSTEHGIKILRVEEDGNMDFMVYGYMSRGTHEGVCGVGIYHYNSDQNMFEENVFIPSTESGQFLKADLGTLSYVNGDGQLFLLMSGELFQINIAESTYEVLEKNISADEFVVSETNAHSAWRITEGEEAGQIRLIDFDSLQTRMIAPQEGQELRPLGFMNEDLVYGILYSRDILTDSTGRVTEGLTSLRIEDFDGNLKKEYSQEGQYIINVTVGRTLMEFELAVKGDNGYTSGGRDNIMNNNDTSAELAEVELTSTDRQGTLVRLALEERPETEEPLVLRAKMRSAPAHVVQLETEPPAGEVYYVYGLGGLDSTWSDPAQAVLRADGQTGTVLNRAQQYVWERGNMRTKLILNTGDVPEIIRSGSLDKAALQEGLGDSGTVIDLTGCSLENVLYEVSAQRAVIARTGADSSRVIVGYDEYNTYLLNPATGEVAPYGMNDSTALFQRNGNVFITYLEAVSY